MKIKRKGAYEYERDWHQNQSALIVPKAVEAYYVEEVPLEEFIKGHEDPYDFFLRTKVPKSSRLVGRETEDHELVEVTRTIPLPNITRYYVAKGGVELFKIMPPLAKKFTKALDAQIKRLGVELTEEQRAKATELFKTKKPFTLREVGMENTPENCQVLALMQPKEREIAIEKGRTVIPCNKVSEILLNPMRDLLDYDYYIEEAEKLLIK